MKREKLSEAEIAAELAKLPGWSIAGGKLRREFVCKDFVDAFGKLRPLVVILCRRWQLMGTRSRQ